MLESLKKRDRGHERIKTKALSKKNNYEIIPTLCPPPFTAWYKSITPPTFPIQPSFIITIQLTQNSWYKWDYLHQLFRYFLTKFGCPFLGASHFGCPPIFWKQFVLDAALHGTSRHEWRLSQSEWEHYKLGNKMSHPIVNVMESQWKPRQQHDQNFTMEGKPL